MLRQCSAIVEGYAFEMRLDSPLADSATLSRAYVRFPPIADTRSIIERANERAFPIAIAAQPVTAIIGEY